jgi:L,D-transpeptidase catalytic domain
MNQLFNKALSIAMAVGVSIVSISALSNIAQPENSINQVNAETPLEIHDRVTVSISEGIMRWRDRSWEVVGSVHTPRGRFRVGESRSGSDYMLDSPIALPFKVVPIDRLSRSHPYYNRIKKEGLRGTVFVIHKNNLRPGEISAGCLLVSEPDLLDIAQVLPGATIVITD